MAYNIINWAQLSCLQATAFSFDYSVISSLLGTQSFHKVQGCIKKEKKLNQAQMFQTSVQVVGCIHQYVTGQQNYMVEPCLLEHNPQKELQIHEKWHG